MGLLGNEGWRKFGLLAGGVIGWATRFGFGCVGRANDAKGEEGGDVAWGRWGADADVEMGVEMAGSWLCLRLCLPRFRFRLDFESSPVGTVEADGTLVVKVEVEVEGSMDMAVEVDVCATFICMST